MKQKVYQIEMEIAGPTALFARPDSGDSPVSFPAPTPSAVRGIFESICGGLIFELFRQQWRFVRPFSTILM